MLFDVVRMGFEFVNICNVGSSWVFDSVDTRLHVFIKISRSSLLPSLRWFDAGSHYADILQWAEGWSGERTLHLLDAFGASCQMSYLGFASSLFFLRMSEGRLGHVNNIEQYCAI